MNVKWLKTESTELPEEVDTQSSPTTVYLRRNIIAVPKENDDGETVLYYEYEEAKLTLIEYQMYVSEKARSDIDYIAMMSDIDLEEV